MLIKNKVVGEIGEFVSLAEEQIKGLKYNE
jgi:hypothetical protein